MLCHEIIVSDRKISKMQPRVQPRPQAPYNPPNVTVNWSSRLNDTNALETTKEIWYMFTSMADMYLTATNLVAYFLLVILILWFRRLRNRANAFIVIIALNVFFYNASMPLLFIGFNVAEYASLLIEHRCYVYKIDEAFRFAMYFFSFILALDWFLLSFHKRFTKRHHTLHKFAMFLSYMVACGRYGYIVATNCVHKYDYYFYLRNFVYGSYLIFAIILCILNFFATKNFKELKANKRTSISKNSLIVANVVVYSWLPLLTYEYFYHLHSTPLLARTVLHLTDLLPNILAHSNGIVIGYVLYKQDEYFRLAFKAVLNWNTERADEKLTLSSDEDTSTSTTTSSTSSTTTDSKASTEEYTVNDSESIEVFDRAKAEAELDDTKVSYIPAFI